VTVLGVVEKDILGHPRRINSINKLGAIAAVIISVMVFVLLELTNV
jgi:hypothetical protein